MWMQVEGAQQRDPHHLAAAQILDADPGPYIIPVAALAEMCGNALCPNV
ncbi:MAG: hypothetical protein ACR2JC_06600 [Chloroflexota bacterium]